MDADLVILLIFLYFNRPYLNIFKIAFYLGLHTCIAWLLSDNNIYWAHMATYIQGNLVNEQYIHMPTKVFVRNIQYTITYWNIIQTLLWNYRTHGISTLNVSMTIPDSNLYCYYIQAQTRTKAINAFDYLYSKTSMHV